MIVPFIPSIDFETSLAFYKALGFVFAATREGDSKTANGLLEDNEIILQDYYVKDWAENSMLIMYVSSLDDFVTKVENLQPDYPMVKLQGPKDFGWGRQIHLIDPAGVLWHVFATPKNTK